MSTTIAPTTQIPNLHHPNGWLQRFAKFEKAMERLLETAPRSMESLTELEQEGIIHRFEYTLALARKTLRDFLCAKGFPVETSRETIRQAQDVGYLTREDFQTILDALNKHRIFARTYEAAFVQEGLTFIKEYYTPMLERLLATLKQHAG
jgi:hypothetical protein